jgi:hypothetical protein
MSLGLKEPTMRLLAYVAFIILPLSKGEAWAEDVPGSPLSKEDAAVIGEAYHLWKAVGDNVWPGWTKISVPMIYVAKDHEYAIDFPKLLPEAHALEQTPLPGHSVQVRMRKHGVNLAASFDVEGINTVVIGRPAALERPAGEWVITALHEMFHVLQAARGSNKKVRRLQIGPEADASWQLNFPFPYDDADVMRLVHLQGYLCYFAAMIRDPDDREYSARTALEAFQVYHRFLEQRDPKSRAAEYSKFQEWTEGAALYTECKVAELAGAGYPPTEAYRQLPGFTPYTSLWKNRYQGQVFLAKHAGRAAQSRLAFYHLGMSKCLLLDRLAPAWKAHYFDETVWLDDLLADAVAGKR